MSSRPVGRHERAVVAGAAAAEAAEAVLARRGAAAQPQAAAFFDVDNTMMRGASIYYFARGLAARKYVTTRDLMQFGWQQVKFRVGGKESHIDLGTVREAALGFVAGKRVEEITGAAAEIYDELMAGRIWAGTRALAQAHVDAGDAVWLVTATPIELATVIANRLGLTGALGTVAEIRDGVYTGLLVGEPLHGPAKAAAVAALAEREGLDLSRCAAYSDSINDLPMLSAVGRATAINPDPALREAARRRGWQVRDFRTGRKAAKWGLRSAAAAGAASGVAVIAASRRRR